MEGYPTDFSNNKKFFDDLIKKKEFYELKKDEAADLEEYTDIEGKNILSIFDNKALQFQGQQLFCRNFISTNTPYQRLLIKHGTGTGKTLAALSIAEQFIAEYKGIYTSAVASFAASLGRRQFGVHRRATIAANNSTPTVIILGFAGTKTAFIKELFRWPEFGYITHEDREKMINMRREAESGDPAKIKLFKETYTSMKRRITEKSRGGFYKFYGYQEFVNRIFIVLKKDLDLLKLEKIALAEAKKSSGGESLEKLLEKHIAAGDIKLNTRLLSQLENSIVICDEAHNLYNSFMKNNYGIAVQYLFDNVPTLRGVLVSATPINSPGEIVDLLNLLSLKDEKRLTKSDLFKNVTEPRELNVGAERIIADRTFGRVSFLQDFSRKYYPERIFNGEEISSIPYLKFIKCKMPRAHAAAYRKLLNEKEEIIDENDIDTDINASQDDEVDFSFNKSGYVAIPSNAYTIYDMVIPARDRKMGVWKSAEINSILNEEAIENTYVFGAAASTKSRNFGMRIRGDFLKKNEIKKWSSKYYSLLESIDDVFAAGNKSDIGAKVMIYHNRVKLSGVLLIEELLRENGIIDEFAPPADDTRCSICGNIAADHKKNSSKGKGDEHKYFPARYIIAHNMIDKVSLDRSIAKFISPDNAYGYGIKFLIGSKIIRESYDIKDVRYQFIMSEPINMPILIQILGRCIRKNSHINLPPELRNVTISIFMNVLPDDSNENTNNQFIEEVHYVEKMKDYIAVQNIERVINSYALDSNFYREQIGTTFGRDKSGRPIDSLDLLYFEPAITFSANKDYDNTTFESYGFGRDETKIIITIIKKLFYIRPVYTYEELWNEIKNFKHPAVNTALFDEDNFCIALSLLISADENQKIFNISGDNKKKKKDQKSVILDTISDNDMIVQYLFNTNNKYIFKGGRKHTIREIDNVFILFPIENEGGVELIDFNTFIEEDSGNRSQYFSLPLKSIKKIDKNYELERDMFKRRFCAVENAAVDNPFFLSFISEYSENFQERLLNNSIVAFLKEKGADDKSMSLYKKVLELYDSFGFLVKISDVEFISADIKKQLTGVPRGAFVGYKYKDEIRLVTAAGTVISTVNPRPAALTENDFIVGFSDSGIGGKLVFKIRRSITSYGDVLKGKSRGQGGQIDLRILDRGINCIYKSKEELLKIAKELSISISDITEVVNKFKKGKKIKIKHLCFAVRDKLLRLEMKERMKGSNKKWFYLWWDKVPDLLK